MGALSHLDAIDQDTKESSVHVLGAWWKKRLATIKVRNTLLTKLNNLDEVLRVVLDIKRSNAGFDAAQTLLSDQNFGVSLTDFLCALPRDVCCRI